MAKRRFKVKSHKPLVTGPAPVPRLKHYHFDCGNSSEGTVGFCAVVFARSPEEALARLVAAEPAEELPVPHLGKEVDYVQVYLNWGALSVADIDSEEDLTDAEIDDLARRYGL